MPKLQLSEALQLTDHAAVNAALEEYAFGVDLRLRDGHDVSFRLVERCERVPSSIEETGIENVLYHFRAPGSNAVFKIKVPVSETELVFSASDFDPLMSIRGRLRPYLWIWENRAGQDYEAVINAFAEAERRPCRNFLADDLSGLKWLTDLFYKNAYCYNITDERALSASGPQEPGATPVNVTLWKGWESPLQGFADTVPLAAARAAFAMSAERFL